MDATNNLHVSRSAERALNLLDLVATEGAMPLGEAAKATDIPVSTALRHLRALVDSGWLQRDANGDYTAGPNLLRVAVRVVQSGPYARLVSLAQAHLDRIATETGESVYLAVRDGDVAAYLAMAESERAIRHVGWVGKEVRIDGTAVGEALRWSPSDGPPLPVFTITGSIEPDVAAASTPIIDLDRQTVIGAFSVLGPASRFDNAAQEAAARSLREASVTLSAELSGSRVA